MCAVGASRVYMCVQPWRRSITRGSVAAAAAVAQRFPTLKTRQSRVEKWRRAAGL